MSFSLRNNNDVTYIFQNSSTSVAQSNIDVSGGYWSLNGSDICNNNLGNVRINTSTVNIGRNNGLTNQTAGAISIGSNAGVYDQSGNTVAIGISAGNCNQGSNSIAIGMDAGLTSQGSNSVAIGYWAGKTSQGSNCVAIGSGAGINQSSNSVAIGINSGSIDQQNGCVAIGQSAGFQNQRSSAIAIGSGAGFISQNVGAVAIGLNAGQTAQGTQAIAIGYFACRTDQNRNSIVIDASASVTDVILVNTQGFFVRPIRSDTSGKEVLQYNPSTKEITIATTKTFVIDHPTHQDKYLVHGCLEGPEAGVYYRGKGEITNNTFEEISLPDYTKNFSDFTIQVTPINSNNSYGVSEVKDGKFKVIGANGKFFWLVHALRNKIDVEPVKSEVTVNGEGPYKYIL